MCVTTLPEILSAEASFILIVSLAEYSDKKVDDPILKEQSKRLQTSLIAHINYLQKGRQINL